MSYILENNIDKDRPRYIAFDIYKQNENPTENKILTILFTHQDQVVSKEELLEKLWEDENFIDQNTLSVNITRLRRKIIPLGFDRVHTVRGVGYLLK